MSHNNITRVPIWLVSVTRANIEGNPVASTITPNPTAADFLHHIARDPEVFGQLARIFTVLRRNAVEVAERLQREDDADAP